MALTNKLYRLILTQFTPVVDAALLKVDDPIRYSTKVKPIQLATVDDVYVPAGTRTMVSGWGLTRNPNESPDGLRGVYVPVVDQKVCNEAYNAAGLSIRSHEICAGDLENGGKDCEFFLILFVVE